MTEAKQRRDNTREIVSDRGTTKDNTREIINDRSNTKTTLGKL